MNISFLKINKIENIVVNLIIILFVQGNYTGKTIICVIAIPDHILLQNMTKYLLFFFALVVSSSMLSQSKMNFALAKKVRSNSSELIDVFVKGDISSIKQLVALSNGSFKYSSGDIAAVKIPVSGLTTLVKNKNIIRVEAYPTHYKVMNDTMLLNNNVIPVHSGQAPLTQGYDGSGIVIGLIDTGIDFTHPDFNDSLGKSRVKFLWDQNLDTAANSPLPYGYGQEWNNLQIDSGLAAGSTDVDFAGHGTHVTGIAAGNGRASGHYGGVAPKADIILVCLNFYSSSSTLITDAVNYIYAKANLLGKPCVINASLGDYYGSHDGLDLQAQLISNMINAQTNGTAFVAAAGNAGNIPFHLGYNVTSDTNFTFFSLSSSSIDFVMWADTANLKNVQFSIGADMMSPSHSFRGRLPFSDISTHLGVIKNDTLYNAGNRIGIIQSYGDISGGVYSMEYNIIPDSTSYDWRLITTGSGKFDLWNFDVVSSGIPSSATMPDSAYYKFPDLNQTMVSSFQCLDNVITVGNYTNRKSYISYTGRLYVDNTKVPGQRHPNSSAGPTRDGRIKPDIAAPGDMILSTVVLSLVPTFAGLDSNVLTQDGFHIRGGGTSAASPGVAGIAALYLQKNPSANAITVKQAITSCTTVDAYTGAVPNNFYGYGKANAFTALTGCLTTGINNSKDLNSFLIYPNPSISGSTVTVDISNVKAKDKVELKIYNALGEMIKKESLTSSTIQLSGLPSGIYFCNLLLNGATIATEKMIIL
ncbi:MAG: S8 family serine peptidase [Bacteroidia bacterium]